MNIEMKTLLAKHVVKSEKILAEDPENCDHTQQRAVIIILLAGILDEVRGHPERSPGGQL